MAEAEHSLYQDQFSCPICLDLLKDPVTIPCGHSYCMGCIKDHCETRLQTRYESAAFKKHTLVKASTQLQEKICSQHDKPLEVFCRRDHQCICLLCVTDGHAGHDTVSAAAERAEKQKQLGVKNREFQQRIQGREKELQELRKAVESLRRSAQAAVEDSERIFTELIRSIERRRSEVKELIRAQEKAELSQAEGLLERLEQEIAELRGRDPELEQLSHTEDHIHFLQSFQSLCAPPGSEVLPSISVNPHFSFGDVRKSVSELKQRLEDFCKQEIVKISAEVTDVQIVLLLEPKTREELLQFSCQLTVDPNTANNSLCLSEGSRKVTESHEHQPYPDHPERFECRAQALCRESVSGRGYWEAEWMCGVSIAVSYKGISRKGWGDECWFGYNDQSWNLICSTNSYSFWHNNIETKIPAASSSSRVGVYLDHRAGTLSFYSISHTMTLLHRVQTTFTQPLYPGVGVDWFGASVEICDLQRDQSLSM